MQNVLPSMPLSPEEETEEEVTVQEKEKMINISYELAAEASKLSKLVAGTSLEREEGGGGGDLIKRMLEIKQKLEGFYKGFLLCLSNCSCFHCACVQSFIIVVLVVSSVIICVFGCLAISCWCNLFVCALCVFHCSEKPVVLFPTPSTVS